MRVVIADDHPHYRRALGRMLRASGVDVVAEVCNGAAAVSAVAVTGADAVLMDIHMPGMSGAEAARTIARRSPDAAVVMLSVFGEEPEVADALAWGANGYVLKDRPVAEIVAAISAAASGKPAPAPALLHRFRGSARVDGRPGVLAES